MHISSLPPTHARTSCRLSAAAACAGSRSLGAGCTHQLPTGTAPAWHQPPDTQNTEHHPAQTVCNTDSTVLAKHRKFTKNWLVWWGGFVCLGFFCLTSCYSAQQSEQIIFTIKCFIHISHDWISANLHVDENRSYDELCKIPLINRDETSPACNFTFFDNNFKYLQKYGWKGENVPRARAIAVGTTGLSV